MPVIRELVNRVRFKINKSDLKKVKTGIVGIRGSAVKLGATLSAVAGSFGMWRSNLEKTHATINFFSKTEEELRKIKNITDILKKDPLISDKDVLEIRAELSKLTVKPEALKDIVPYISLLNKAMPQYEPEEIAKMIADFAINKDVDSLKQMGVFGKELTELLKLSPIDLGQVFKTQENALNFLAKHMKLNESWLKEISEKQDRTLTNATKELSATVSDSITRISHSVAPALKTAAKALSSFIGFLNMSESERDEHFKEKIKKRKTGDKKTRERISRILEQDEYTFSPKNNEEAKIFDELLNKKLNSKNTSTGTKNTDQTHTQAQKQDININVGGTIKVEGGANVNGDEITKAIVEPMKEMLNNVQARYSTGGTP